MYKSLQVKVGFHTHYSRKHNGQTYQRDTEKSLYCDQCFKYFTTKRGLSVHTRAVHQNRYPYICRICDKGYMSSEGYRCHFLKHGGMKKMCNRCNSTFSTENNLQRHLKSSFPANTESHDKFECSTCNLEFHFQVNLEGSRERYPPGGVPVFMLLWQVIQMAFLTCNA